MCLCIYSCHLVRLLLLLLVRGQYGLLPYSDHFLRRVQDAPSLWTRLLRRICTTSATDTTTIRSLWRSLQKKLCQSPHLIVGPHMTIIVDMCKYTPYLDVLFSSHRAKDLALKAATILGETAKVAVVLGKGAVSFASAAKDAPAEVSFPCHSRRRMETQLT